MVFFVPLGPEEEARADILAQQLRKEGIAAEVSFRRSSPGNQMKRADALGARFALVLGDAELKSGRAKLKEMKSGAEHEVDLTDLTSAVRKLSQ
jgi:histidyl-tRNA synthetase